jgi:hypothetical protein
MKSVNSKNGNDGGKPTNGKVKKQLKETTKVKSIKKTMNKSRKRSIKKVSKENLLMTRFLYDAIKSNNDRKKALGNAVIVYDPHGLYDLLKSMESNETNSDKKTILKKDSEYVKKTYFKFIQ